MNSKIRLGISRCLLGEQVRYDGQHKHDPFLTDTLGAYVEFVGVCPEVECGLPVPRESMRLVGDPAAPRLITRETGRDLTGQMQSWIAGKLPELEKANLCGFIFKSRSPSSGMERVKVYNAKGMAAGRSPGLFAKAFLERFPLLPAEDEGRLHDPLLRENFIERIFALHRYREDLGAGRTTARLMKFHEHNKLLIMSHSPDAVSDMGRLLARAKGTPIDRVASDYESMLLVALRKIATPAKHANVLQHMMGYFKDQLSADEKQELLSLIDGMRNGVLPLIVPVTMIAHYVRKHRVQYLADQTYLNPHPLELQLRNHA